MAAPSVVPLFECPLERPDLSDRNVGHRPRSMSRTPAFAWKAGVRLLEMHRLQVKARGLADRADDERRLLSTQGHAYLGERLPAQVGHFSIGLDNRSALWLRS